MDTTFCAGSHGQDVKASLMRRGAMVTNVKASLMRRGAMVTNDKASPVQGEVARRAGGVAVIHSSSPEQPKGIDN